MEQEVTVKDEETKPGENKNPEEGRGDDEKEEEEEEGLSLIHI